MQKPGHHALARQAAGSAPAAKIAPQAQPQAPAQQEQQLPLQDSVEHYEKLHRIGEGTYGIVYKAKDKHTGQIVALKRVRFDRARDGVPVTTIREMRVLQQCQHPNIVRLLKIVTGSKADSVFLVFEFCDFDLGRVLDAKPQPFTLPQVKQLMMQLLRAVAYLHARWVLHRDIKMSNLLYCRNGELKLCDLGLARHFQHEQTPMTPRVVTLWYRAPEVLLGSEVYGPGVDMWAVGCVLGELLGHRALFPATTEIHALRMQVELLGTPTSSTWPDFDTLPYAGQFKLPQQPLCRLHTITDPHTSLDQAAAKPRRRHSLSPPRARPHHRHHRGDSSGEEGSPGMSPAARDGRGVDGWGPQSARRGRPASPPAGAHRHDDDDPHSLPRSRSRSRSRSRDRGTRARHRDDGEHRGGGGEHRRRERTPDERSDRDRPQSSRKGDGQGSGEVPPLLDLLRRLLAWDPSRRISAKQALQHPWFAEAPAPCRLVDMPSRPIPDSHAHRHHHSNHHHQQPNNNNNQAQAAVPPLLAQLPRALAADRERRWGNAFDVPSAGGRPGH